MRSAPLARMSSSVAALAPPVDHAVSARTVAISSLPIDPSPRVTTAVRKSMSVGPLEFFCRPERSEGPHASSRRACVSSVDEILRCAQDDRGRAWRTSCTHRVLIASSTSSTWPLTLTLRQIFRTTPSPSIRKVARSMPMYLRPYRLFSIQVPYFSQILPSSSDTSGKLSWYLALNLSWRATLSLLTPITCALSFLKAAAESRKPQASVVQPGVSSLG